MNAESPKPDVSNDILIMSVGFLLFLFNLFAVSTLLFLVGIPVTAINGAISLLLTFAFVGTQARRKIRTVVISFSLIAASILLVSFFYDGSWDGNVYHKLCAGLIKSGWNPVYETFDDFANNSGRFLQSEWNGFYDGYPKASYIIGGSLYALTGSIESGKAFTLLSMLSSIGIIAVFLREIGRTMWWQSLLVAFFSCFSAVTIGSIITYYNDGFLAMLIYNVLFSFLYLALDTAGRYDKLAYAVIFISVTVGVNIKFSALFPFAIICLAFFTLLLVSKGRRYDVWLFPRASTGKTFAFLAITAIWGIAVLGLTSYVRNIFFHHNPLFPLIGDNKEDVLAVATPPAFRNLPPLEQFFGSLFSAISHDPKLATIPLKIPFSADFEEVRNNLYWGARAGGWGIFYSGILLVSLITYLFLIRRAGKSLNTAFLCVAVVTVIPAFFIPGLNTARYWPLPALIPPFVLFILFATVGIPWKALTIVATALAANIVLPIGGLVLAAKQSLEAHGQVRDLAAEDRNGSPLVISLGASYLATRENLSTEAPGFRRMHGTQAFNGIIFNLDDGGIRRFTQVKPGDVDNFEGLHGLVNFSVGKRSPTPIGFVYVLLAE